MERVHLLLGYSCTKCISQWRNAAPWPETTLLTILSQCGLLYQALLHHTVHLLKEKLRWGQKAEQKWRYGWAILEQTRSSKTDWKVFVSYNTVFYLMKNFAVETSYFQSVLLHYVFAQVLPSHTYAVAMSLYQIKSEDHCSLWCQCCRRSFAFAWEV